MDSVLLNQLDANITEANVKDSDCITRATDKIFGDKNPLKNGRRGSFLIIPKQQCKVHKGIIEGENRSWFVFNAINKFKQVIQVSVSSTRMLFCSSIKPNQTYPSYKAFADSDDAITLLGDPSQPDIVSHHYKTNDGLTIPAKEEVKDEDGKVVKEAVAAKPGTQEWCTIETVFVLLASGDPIALRPTKFVKNPQVSKTTTIDNEKKFKSCLWDTYEENEDQDIDDLITKYKNPETVVNIAADGSDISDAKVIE